VYLYEQARIPRMDATMLENTNQNRKRWTFVPVEQNENKYSEVSEACDYNSFFIDCPCGSQYRYMHWTVPSNR
jgi:hypothetical protein